MRYEVTQSQLAYFEKNKNILFEDFFPPATTAIISTFSAGYDLWRNHPEIKKMTCYKELGDLLSQLTGVKPIRLLFDRIVKDETIDLMTSSFQGVVAGVVVYPTSLAIFSAETPFLVEEKGLLIAYGELEAVFAYRENDLYAARLKKQGYTYGDALSTDDYPLIYR